MKYVAGKSMRCLVQTITWVLSVSLCGFACLYSYAQKGSSKDSSPEPPPLLLGAAWYPEQWAESRWNADLDLMQQAHMHLVRIGEFSWSRLEPSDGNYDLDWMERAINLAGRHGLYVIIATPSSAPPAWLVGKFPETQRILENGTHAAHGERADFNWNNDKYRDLVRQMDERLAQRFGNNPYVIGWQIDNEYAQISFDPVTRARFQSWLKVRYKTLDTLNTVWTTNYWSQSYSAWDQIPIETANGNPGLMLDWKRFVSDTWRSYQKNQMDAIRKYADRKQRITSNMMGWYFDGYDHYVVSQDLDFAAWDDPIGQGHLDPIRNGAAHDLTRGFKHRNFWVMETTAGPTGWADVNPVLDKGAMRAAMWHDIGHGADAISYWQWRDALNGQEQNHGAIVGVDGAPDLIYSEIAQVGREFEIAGPVLKGTTVQSRVAILHSFESRWAINWQRLHKNYDPIEELLSYYKPLHDLGNSIDIVQATDDLSRYKLVVAPGLNVLTKAAAENLLHYVEQGGYLVLGQRTGMKDDSNSRWPQRQPGPLTQILGAHVEQYFALMQPVSVSGAWGESKALMYAESLSPIAPDVKVLMRYGISNGWIDNQPAVVARKVGTGTIVYVGVWLDEPGMKRAAQWILRASEVKPDLLQVPEGVEVYRRVGEDRQVFIVDNLSPASQTILLPVVMHDAFTGQMVQTVKLPVYGVVVLVEKRPQRPPD